MAASGALSPPRGQVRPSRDALRPGRSGLQRVCGAETVAAEFPARVGVEKKIKKKKIIKFKLL